MLEHMGIDDPQDLIGLRYRGNGWPGQATATFRNKHGETETRELTYAQSWGEILQKHRQWRCHVCADHTGEFADVAVGDPWYRKIVPGEPGNSLILARTKRGQDAIEAAIRDGYLVAKKVDPQLLPASQDNLLSTRGSVWGRIATCRVLGIPAPHYNRIPLFRFWLSKLSIKKKTQSVTGTIRRIFRRKLHRRVKIDACTKLEITEIDKGLSGERCECEGDTRTSVERKRCSTPATL